MKYPDSKNIFTIEEAYRYLSNAKETLQKSPIEYGRYTDAKYVSEAAGICYLAALKALDTYLLSKGILKKELPKSFDGYFAFVRKHIPLNGKLYSAMTTVYENLHVFAYYRGGTEILMVKSGFENVKKIIEMMKSLLGKKGTFLKAEESSVHYRRMNPKKINVKGLRKVK